MAAELQLSENRPSSHTALHRLRPAVQIAVFLFFLYLLLSTRREVATFLPQNLFFQLDPLTAISAMFASRSWIGSMALSGSILVVTFLVGRAWCGWLCPLGTLLDFAPTPRLRRNSPVVDPHLRKIKYSLLLAILSTATLGTLTLLILDPITLLFRALANAVLPLSSSFIMMGEKWAYGIVSLQPAVQWFDSIVRSTLLIEQPFLLANLTMALLLASVLALNVIYPRFWCRYLCPLGALLGSVSVMARIRHRLDPERCISCQRCAIICPTGAIEAEKFLASSAECISCLDCVDSCPTEAIAFRGRSRSHIPVDNNPQRRRLMISLGAAMVGLVLISVAPIYGRMRSRSVRPPGASEEEFLRKCIRCGECARICPTGVIQPSHSPLYLEELWTPQLETRLGYCDYSCTSCGQVCPSGAITELPLIDKQKTIIGTARIDRKRCLPWAEDRECIVCEEMCPVPQKAIRLEKRVVVHSSYEVITLLQPTVIPDLCIGCGICEYKCPLDGEAAIRIYPNRL